MGKSRRKVAIKVPKTRTSGSMVFSAVMIVVVLVGVVGIVLSRDPGPAGAGDLPIIGDHYHALLGVNICGEWKPNTPPYNSPLGLHAHEDAFMHIHPSVSSGAGENATIGLFLDQGGRELTTTSIKLEDGTDLENGDECANLDNKPGKIRWSVNGKDQEGDPSEYVPSVCAASPVRQAEEVPTQTCDTLAVAFLPDGEEIGTPPAAADSNQITDLPGGGTVPLDPGGTPAPAPTPDTAVTTGTTGTTGTTSGSASTTTATTGG